MDQDAENEVRMIEPKVQRKNRIAGRRFDGFTAGGLIPGRPIL
jgi:hypothetical protein